MNREEAIERFEKKFKKVPLGCWEWQASKHPKGYASFSLDGKVTGAHRASFKLYVGEVQKGMCVCHRCDNPGCVNPSHLYLGTNAENTHDRDNKGRGSYGEGRPNAKLTEQKVNEIKGKWLAGNTMASIGREYGVSRQTISTIIHLKKWKRVKPPRPGAIGPETGEMAPNGDEGAGE